MHPCGWRPVLVGDPALPSKIVRLLCVDTHAQICLCLYLRLCRPVPGVGETVWVGSCFFLSAILTTVALALSIIGWCRWVVGYKPLPGWVGRTSAPWTRLHSPNHPTEPPRSQPLRELAFNHQFGINMVTIQTIQINTETASQRSCLSVRGIQKCRVRAPPLARPGFPGSWPGHQPRIAACFCTPRTFRLPVSCRARACGTQAFIPKTEACTGRWASPLYCDILPVSSKHKAIVPHWQCPGHATEIRAEMTAAYASCLSAGSVNSGPMGDRCAVRITGL